MKKFILFTLLASGLSAHAMPGGNQKNGGQSNDRAHPTIAQQRQARVQRMMAREAVEEGRAKGENQAQAVQQDHATEDLNQRSEGELAPAGADAQEVQRDTMPRPAVSQAQAAQDNAVGAVERQAQAEREQAHAVQQAPAAEDLGQRSEDEWDRAVTNILYDIDRKNEEHMARIEKEREEYKARIEKERGLAEKVKNQAEVVQQDHAPEDLNQRSAFEEDEVAPAAPSPVDTQGIQIDTRSRPISNFVAAREEIQIETRAQQNKGFAFEFVKKRDHLLRECLKYLYTDEGTHLLSLLNKKAALNRPDALFNTQSVLAFDSELSPARFLNIFQEATNRRNDQHYPLKELIFDSNCTIGGHPVGIHIFQLNNIPAPVKLTLVSDSLQNFLNILRNNNPQNLPFNEWKTAYFGAVSPEKINLWIDNTVNVTFEGWQRCAAFLNANQAQLNPNNFTITATSISTSDVGLVNNPIFLHLTGMENFYMSHRRIPIDHLRVCLQNNAPTLTTLDLMSIRYTDAELLDLAPAFANMSLLRAFRLCDNRISDVAMRALGPAFANMKALEDLNLNFNRFGCEGAKDLARVVSSMPALRRLDLHYNNIGDVGAKALLEALSNNSTLKVLDLQDNDISDDVKSELKEVCRTKKINLKI